MRCGRSGMTLVALLGIVALVGCGPDPKKQLADMAAERDQLKDQLKNANDAQRLAESNENAARQSIEQLRQQLRDAQARGAVSQKPDAKGWIGMPGFDMISIPGEVLFDSGKNGLRPAGKAALDRIVSDIRGRYPDRDIYVFGHTDNEPIKKSGWKDNWELSAQRSLTVCRYLASGGIPPKNIIQAGCGEHRPKAPNAVAQAKQQNRRVEFYAVQKRGTSDAPVVTDRGGDESRE